MGGGGSSQTKTRPDRTRPDWRTRQDWQIRPEWWTKPDQTGKPDQTSLKQTGRPDKTGGQDQTRVVDKIRPDRQTRPDQSKGIFIYPGISKSLMVPVFKIYQSNQIPSVIPLENMWILILN